ncbi:hypothetical protein ACFYU5_36330 [Nocardia aobensis]|uniref:SnoaL-like domain-containing protein n=1 Tax=Nocardia aobensis TaxID=257277 RepID=A0ABW6PFI8_9NOCA
MSYEPTDIELKNLLDRWIGQWNEPDAGRRRELIREVWAEDGYQILVNPPEGIRDTARQYGVSAPAVEVRGYDAMFARVTRAYEMFVADGEHFFEAEGEPVRHAGAAVALTWVMRSRADDTVAGAGLEVLTFDPDGRVRTDHEFVN